MKAKIWIGILVAALLPGFMAQAQVNDSRDYRNDNSGTEINNYYNYDYYYSSRINRFHRSFLTFNYYTPMFTDSYWYNYEPLSLGLSIYGGISFGLGYSYNYPVYNDYSWNWPYSGGYFYSGYDPFYYNRWYSPVVTHLGTWNRWDQYYYSSLSRNRWDNDYRHVNNRYGDNYYNDYRSNNRPSNSNISRRSEFVNNNSANTTVPRRPGSNYTQTEMTRENNNKSTSSDNKSVTRRGVNPSNNQNAVIDNRSVNNNSNRTNRSVINPADKQINRRSQQIPVRNQSNVSNNSVRSGIDRNTVKNSSVVKSEPASSNVKSVSSSSNKKSSAKTGSRASRRSSSKEQSKK